MATRVLWHIGLVLAAPVALSLGDVTVCDDVAGGCAAQSDEATLLQMQRQKMKIQQTVKKFFGHKLQGGCHGRYRNIKGNAGVVNGPTLDSNLIPKYVTPLVIPLVMEKDQTDRYEIAVRQFKQQILPGGIWNSEVFKKYNRDKKFDFPPTTVWSFGPASNEKPDSSDLGGGKGIAPAPNSQFNYPAYTMDTITNVPVKVDWINQLVKNPWRCDWRKPPKCWGLYAITNAHQCCHCKFIRHITAVDQSLHWANVNRLPCMNGRKQDCMPKNQPALKYRYNGPVPMVVHLHGAHVEPESDGYPEAWWLPAASDIPFNYAKLGTFVNKYGKGRKTNLRPGVAEYTYRNDQPTTTLWFHDHTLGITRNNVYAGPAGFWLIRKADGGEDGLVYGTLPHPAPKAGDDFENQLPPKRNKYREIPVLIQDRSFNDDGSLYYPSDRAFFENLSTDALKIPLLGDRDKTDVPAIWNPETFFDVMVVNGVSWPQLEVEPDIYRLRLLNGCNCRTLNLALFIVDRKGRKLKEVPFYVIGGDQSLLPNVVQVMTNYSTALPGDGTVPTQTASSPGEALLMGPAYRSDVLIDFRGMKKGTFIQMFNTGPDGPFGGTFDEPADPEKAGQVMRFRVVKNTRVGDDATAPWDLKLELPRKDSPSAQPGIGANPRDVALLEHTSKYICAYASTDGDGNKEVLWNRSATPVPGQDVCVDKHGNELPSVLDTDTKPFTPVTALIGSGGSEGIDTAVAKQWDSPISQNPALDSTETWVIYDYTADAHPIHIHLVHFKVLGRAPILNLANGSLGDLELPNPTDNGWKDTILVYPGTATYVKATFNLPGLYVWHCHMLEHEDQEMMLPMCVGDMKTAPGCGLAG